MTSRSSLTSDTILPARRPRLRDRLHPPGRRAQAAPRAHRRAPAALFAAMAVFAAATLAVVPGTPSPAGASTEPVTFAEPGEYTYTVPDDVTELEILAAGGKGGDVWGRHAGGAGGLVHAVVPVVPGETLDVTVAGAGSSGTGGFGGGGPGVGGGGGASRVHVAWSGEPLVVAGGGGGAGNYPVSPVCGGAGGGPTLPDGLDGCGDGIFVPEGGKGATTSGPGAGGTGFGDGFDGEPGSGSTGGLSWHGGGGGGGYFGGGGGASSDCCSFFGGGGGGGSSFAAPQATQVVYGVVDGHELVNDGNGFVRIAPGSVLPIGIEELFVNPSEDCQFFGGDRVIDNSSQGVHTFVWTYQPSATELWVCLRAESSTGDARFGGKVVITPDPPEGGGVGVPGHDTNSSTCTTTTPNEVPGSHPVATGGVGPVDYMFDLYSDGETTVWVCFEVDDVNIRVTVPVSADPPSSGNQVTWYPDPNNTV